MKNLRSRLVTAVIATNLLLSPFGINGDTSKLAGKKFSQNRDLVDSVMKGRNYVVEVNQHGDIKQVIDAGANGSGQDTQQKNAGGSSADAQAESDRNTVSSVEMPVNYQGQTAIDFIGADLPVIAERHNLTPDKLKELVLTDKTIRIDSNKRIFFTDDSADGHNQTYQTVAAGDFGDETMANNLHLPIGMTLGTVDAFKLHSKAKASKTIYLDFNGYTAMNSVWSVSTLKAPAFDLDGNPNTFNTAELSKIISIWSRVAEDFIPFDVDVTTEEPSADALIRSSKADDIYGTRVVITKTGTIRCYCGGIAYVGTVAAVNAAAFQPVWVFQQSLANNEKYIAEAASHEAGHNLGLFHDGQQTGTSTNYYYEGHGSGVMAWAPIMGVGYYKNVTQWSNGQYPGANNLQDDLAVFAANGFTLSADDAGNTFATANPLINSASTGVRTVGVIEDVNDVDMFRIDTTGGLLELKVKPASIGPNLNTKLALFKEDGAILAQNARESELSSSISTTVPAGTYFLSVSGSSHTAAGTDHGYPGYGSLGQYLITGTYPVADIAAPPRAVLTASQLTGTASLTVNFSANRSVGHGNIIGYRWSFGNGTYSTNSSPAHTYSKAGTYRATLTVIDQAQLTDTKSVQIKVIPPPPTKLYASSLRLNLFKKRNVSAKAAITVVDEKKRPIPNAIVKGFWSGSFSGATRGITGTNGIAVQTAKPIPATRGGSANFTITSIESFGYVYRPGRSRKKIVTISW